MADFLDIEAARHLPAHTRIRTTAAWKWQSVDDSEQDPTASPYLKQIVCQWLTAQDRLFTQRPTGKGERAPARSRVERTVK